jgi:hypothetical protein
MVMLSRKAMMRTTSVTPWYRLEDAAHPVAAYEPFGAASLADSYINVANPGTFDAASGVAPTFGLGWDFLASSSQYLTTGITAGQNWSAFVCIANVTLNVGCAFGTDAANNSRFYLWPRHASGVVYGGGGLIIAAPQLAAGTLAIGGHQGYRNGVADGAATAAYVGDPPWPLLIGALAAAATGAASQFMTGSILYLAIWDTIITDVQFAAMDAAVQEMVI